MKYSRSQTIEALRKGESVDFLFFWGHQPSKDGSITKSCFSQWWIVPFNHDGIEYISAEHFMMAEKARLFEDAEMRHKIITAKTPKEAKVLGRKVRNFDPTIWDAHKYDIVIKANELKFSQNPELGAYLKATNNQTIVEASPFDRIWGIGMSQNNPKALDPEQWNGENLLGYVLMEVREDLLNQE